MPKTWRDRLWEDFQNSWPKYIGPTISWVVAQIAAAASDEVFRYFPIYEKLRWWAWFFAILFSFGAALLVYRWVKRRGLLGIRWGLGLLLSGPVGGAFLYQGVHDTWTISPPGFARLLREVIQPAVFGLAIGVFAAGTTILLIHLQAFLKPPPDTPSQEEPLNGEGRAGD